MHHFSYSFRPAKEPLLECVNTSAEKVAQEASTLTITKSTSASSNNTATACTVRGSDNRKLWSAAAGSDVTCRDEARVRKSEATEAPIGDDHALVGPRLKPSSVPGRRARVT